MTNYKQIKDHEIKTRRAEAKLKKCDVQLTILEMEIIKSALEIGSGDKFYSNLSEKIDEWIYLYEDESELTEEEWEEKYGCKQDD